MSNAPVPQTYQTTLTASTATKMGPVETVPRAYREGVLFHALATNTAIVWIGSQGSAAVATGFPLSPGDTLQIGVDDPTRVWGFTTGTGQVVAMLWI